MKVMDLEFCFLKSVIVFTDFWNAKKKTLILKNYIEFMSIIYWMDSNVRFLMQ